MKTREQVSNELDEIINNYLEEAPHVPDKFLESAKLGFVKTQLIEALIRIDKLENKILI